MGPVFGLWGFLPLTPRILGDSGGNIASCVYCLGERKLRAPRTPTPPTDRSHTCLPICSQLNALQLKDHLRRHGDAARRVPLLLAVHPQVTAAQRTGDGCRPPSPFPGPCTSCSNTLEVGSNGEALTSARGHPLGQLAQARPRGRVPHRHAHSDGHLLPPERRTGHSRLKRA